MRRSVLLGFILGANAVQSSTALAAEPIALGPGNSPAIAVDAAGTAYIAYNGTEPSVAKLHFCRLPRGATACATAVDLSIPASGTSLTRPFVSVSGSTVRVLSYRYGTPSGDRDFEFTSADGGATFDAPTVVGDLDFGGDAVEGPGAGVSLVNSAAANHQFQFVPFSGPASATRATLSTTFLYGGAVGLVDASTPMVAFDDGAASPSAAFSVYRGAGSLNDGGNWSAAKSIGPGASEHLAGGPSGLFLMVNAGGHREVRKYDGAAFGSPTTIPGSATNITGEHLFQDSAGRLHASWADASGTVFYASSPDGTTWTTQQVVVGATAPRELRLSATADHQGVVVYTTDTPTGPSTRAVAFGPPPPPPPPARIGADFSYSPVPPCTGVQITFSAAASAALSDDPIVDYLWEFHALSDGAAVDPPFDAGASSTATQIYRSNRSKQSQTSTTNTYFRDPASVTLTVTDNRGRKASVTKVVTFGDPERTVFDSGYGSFAALFSTPPPDPIPLCRTQKAVRTPFGAALAGNVTIGITAVSAASTCRGPLPCGGYFGVIADSPRRIIPRAAKQSVRRPTVLAVKRFALTAGHTRKLTARFSSKGRAFIKAHRLKRATVVLLTLGPRGDRDTTTRVIKLKRPG